VEALQGSTAVLFQPCNDPRDVVGLTDDTWLDIAGYFHTNNIHVVERLRREGNTLTWQAPVEDPEVLLEPWTMNPRVLRLNMNPKASRHADVAQDRRRGVADYMVRRAVLRSHAALHRRIHQRGSLTTIPLSR
jgi:hypothetical protein